MSDSFLQQVLSDGYDSIFHTQVTDTSAGQMLLLKPTKETVHLITSERAMIDEYFKLLNAPLTTKFFIQTDMFRYEDGVLSF